MTTTDLRDLRHRIERARRAAAEFRERGAGAKAVAHERLAEHLSMELKRMELAELTGQRRDTIRAWRAP